MGNRIFREHRKAVGGDHIRDSVVDFRIHMVGTSCQNNAAPAVFLHPFQGFFALSLDILSGGG